MEWRYAMAGVNLLSLSLLLLLAGLSAGVESLAGVSASAAVLGGVLLALGLAYGEPLKGLYRDYSATLAALLARVAEDAGLLENFTLQACPGSDGRPPLLLASSGGPVDCGAAAPGALPSGSRVYLAAPAAPLKPPEELADLGEALRVQLVERYGVCGGVLVEEVHEGFRVTLAGLPGEIVEGLGSPFNPVDAAVLVAVAETLGRGVQLVDRLLLGDRYTLRLRVV